MTFVSERRAANLLAQIRWRDGVDCLRCRAKSVIRYGSYRVVQRYRCKICDRTFHDRTDTDFKHSAIALRKWILAIYTYIRLNTSLSQLDVQLDVIYKMIYRRFQHNLRALDAPQPQLEGPIEIGEVYVKAGLKGRERDQESRSHGLATRGHKTRAEDNPPVFILTNRESDDVYLMPAKTADESTVRLLLAFGQQESVTVYTDGFRPYEALDEDDAFDHECVVHGNGEYVNGDVHVNTCEGHASLTRRWLSPHQGISQDRPSPHLRTFQLRGEVFRKPGERALETILKTAL